MKLDDVDFNFSGNLSFDKIIIFNSKNDTLFYAPNITINPKSVQNAIIDNNYDFDNVSINNGLFFIQNFETIDFLKSGNSLKTFTESSSTRFLLSFWGDSLHEFRIRTRALIKNNLLLVKNILFILYNIAPKT